MTGVALLDRSMNLRRKQNHESNRGFPLHPSLNFPIAVNKTGYNAKRRQEERQGIQRPQAAPRKGDIPDHADEDAKHDIDGDEVPELRPADTAGEITVVTGDRVREILPNLVEIQLIHRILLQACRLRPSAGMGRSKSVAFSIRG
jgi:hypothetical protein